MKTSKRRDSGPTEGVERALDEFDSVAAEVETDLRRRGVVEPDPKAVEHLSAAFWRIWIALEEALPALEDGRASSPWAMGVRGRLLPILGRSRYFWRSMLKPHGHSGDYLLLEWMYDLEATAGRDAFQAPFVNALDSVYASVHSVQGVWHRRRWLRDRILSHLESEPQPVLLDVACGGARYLVDALERSTVLPEQIVLVDQDPAALNYASQRLSRWADRVETVCLPLKRIGTFVAERQASFSIVVSAGLFDYLDQIQATTLVRGLATTLREGGEMAITNFHPDDPSRLCKEWGADWAIVYRNQHETAALFPSSFRVATEVSPNGSLVLASARKLLVAERGREQETNRESSVPRGVA